MFLKIMWFNLNKLIKFPIFFKYMNGMGVYEWVDVRLCQLIIKYDLKLLLKVVVS